MYPKVSQSFLSISDPRNLDQLYEEMVKNLPAGAGDLGSTPVDPGSGRRPGEGNGNPLQYSCLENYMDRGSWQAAVHGVSKSQT